MYQESILLAVHRFYDSGIDTITSLERTRKYQLRVVGHLDGSRRYITPRLHYEITVQPPIYISINLHLAAAMYGEEAQQDLALREPIQTARGEILELSKQQLFPM